MNEYIRPYEMYSLMLINKGQKLQRTRLTNFTIHKLKTSIYKKVPKTKSKDKLRETFKSQPEIYFPSTKRKQKNTRKKLVGTKMNHLKEKWTKN